MRRFKRLQRRSILRKQEEERELNALGMLPLSSIRAITLLMTSATSSLSPSLYLSLSLRSQDVSLQPAQLSHNLSKHKAGPTLFLPLIQVMTLARIRTESLSFAGLCLRKKNQTMSPFAVGVLITSLIEVNSSILAFTRSRVHAGPAPLANKTQSRLRRISWLCHQRSPDVTITALPLTNPTCFGLIFEYH